MEIKTIRMRDYSLEIQKLHIAEIEELAHILAEIGGSFDFSVTTGDIEVAYMSYDGCGDTLGVSLARLCDGEVELLGNGACSADMLFPGEISKLIEAISNEYSQKPGYHIAY